MHLLQGYHPLDTIPDRLTCGKIHNIQRQNIKVKASLGQGKQSETQSSFFPQNVQYLSLTDMIYFLKLKKHFLKLKKRYYCPLKPVQTEMEIALMFIVIYCKS